MPRYIDADVLYKKIFPLDVVDKRRYSINEKAVSEAIVGMPTADVAPRAAVAREIFEEIRDLIRFTMEPNSTILYAKIEFEKLAELKKKYTEAETEPPKGDAS